MSPQVDYPWAIPYWAHPNNYYRPENHGGIPNKPRGFVIHTPEEPAGDGYPGTPIWFQKDLPTLYGYAASTTYFLEAVEDPNRPGFCKVYQCVPENCAAVANGVIGKPYPAWADRNTSLNWQTLSLEWEGKAASIHQTIDAMQMRTAAHLIAHRAAFYGFDTDREHVIGHYQVSNERTDPGPRFPWDALMAELNQEDDMLIRNPDGSPKQGWNNEGHRMVMYNDSIPVLFIGDEQGQYPGMIAKNFGGQLVYLANDGKGGAFWTTEPRD